MRPRVAWDGVNPASSDAGFTFLAKCAILHMSDKRNTKVTETWRRRVMIEIGLVCMIVVMLFGVHQVAYLFDQREGR